MDKKKTAAIIAELNPMHRGHAWLIRQARESCGADRVIMIMSGDFVQRGAPACINKYDRCRMALACGADLVLELPCLGALSSAEGFAQSAVSILDSLGIVDLLCFGCEDADPAMLLTLAGILNDEPVLFKNTLETALREGKSYPAAREQAVTALFPGQPGLLSLLKKPNNILAVEYCRALLKLDSGIRPAPVLRKGQAYHDLSTKNPYASASAIRDLLLQLQKGEKREDLLCGSGSFPADSGEKDQIRHTLERTMPAPCAALLQARLDEGGLLDTEDFSDMILYALHREKGRLDRYSDVSSDLADRIEAFLYSSADVSDLALACAARTWTQSRIRRCLFHILLGHSRDLMDAWKREGFTGYVNVLGLGKEGPALLSAIRPQIRSHMILRSADRKNLTGASRLLSENDLLASELWRSVYARKYQTDRQSVLREPLIRL